MQDSTLRFLAWMVLSIDLLIFVVSLIVAYITIKYRAEIIALYDYIKLMHSERGKSHD